MSKYIAQIESALNRLSKVFPDADNSVGLDVSYYGDSGYTIPSFYAESSATNGFSGLGCRSPSEAVSTLLRNNHITRVEEYIRTHING